MSSTIRWRFYGATRPQRGASINGKRPCRIVMTEMPGISPHVALACRVRTLLRLYASVRPRRRSRPVKRRPRACISADPRERLELQMNGCALARLPMANAASRRRHHVLYRQLALTMVLEPAMLALVRSAARRRTRLPIWKSRRTRSRRCASGSNATTSRCGPSLQGRQDSPRRTLCRLCRGHRFHRPRTAGRAPRRGIAVFALRPSSASSPSI